ncbi:MAG TPA: glycine cleavage system aminomethyltransferase GcvT [Steroidobacteraceae bacterium]|nr:glycine cleavage system aminomethyltransferase GcvT [Steroidobacteraceae bacterium]
MGRHTCLYGLHVALGARMVDFGGWDMPVAYGSQIEEHQAVRQAAGVFDVSHMCIVDLAGAHTRGLLEQLLSNDIGRLTRENTALYSCLLNDAAGIIDDLLAYWLGGERFRLVVNAATRDKDIAWIGAHAERVDVKLLERRDLAMLAVQGPQARQRCAMLLPSESASAVMALAPFSGLAIGSWFISRTGYSGEDGFEIMLPASEAGPIWQRLNAVGVRSCGLGARDTLRLEAGLHLYGNDMDEQTHPLESGLGFTVAFDPPQRQFIGRTALQAIREHGSERRLVGLVLDERAVLRSHQRVVVPGVGEGEVTSGSFSPSLGRSIGLARVPQGVGERVQVEVRERMLPARVVRPPFARHGRVMVPL